MKAFTLLKARLKSSILTKAYLKDLYERDRLWILPVAGVGIIAAAGFFLFMLYMNYQGLFSIGINMGRPEIVFLFSGIISGLLVFFIGTPLCLSNIFYSKDNILVASLPVSTADIIFSRVFLVYLFVLPVHLAITIPAAVVYIPAAGSPSAWISLILTCLFAPLFPTVLALLAASLLAVIGKISGRRTFFEMAGMLGALIIAALLQLSFTRAMITGGDFSAVASVLTRYTGILEKIFFASSWFAFGFAASHAVWVLPAVVFSASTVLIAFFLLKRIKIDFSSTTEKQPSRKRKKTDSGLIPAAGRSRTGALLRRELAVLRSNSAFLIEIAGEVVILPIMLTVFYFSVPGEMLDVINEFTGSVTFLPLAILGLLILMSSINSISCTSISREGTSFTVSKNLPINGSMQIRAKMYFHLILFVSSWFLNLVILMLILDIPAINLFYLVPAGPAVILLGFITGIHIDLSRPVLNWTHPQQAMKQNMNVLTGMGFGILTLAGVMLPSAGLYFISGNILLSGFAAAATAAIIDFILLPKLFRYSDRRYIEISL